MIAKTIPNLNLNDIENHIESVFIEPRGTHWKSKDETPMPLDETIKYFINFVNSLMCDA